MKARGEYMVVIWEHVADVYDEAMQPALLERHAGREQRTEKCEKEVSPSRKFRNDMGGMGTTLHLLYCLRYYQRAVILLTFVEVKPTDGIYADECSRGCFFYFLPLILDFNFAKNQIDPFFGLILAAAMLLSAIPRMQTSI